MEASKIITSLGKTNQAKLRNALGFKTINKAIEYYGETLAPDRFKKIKKYSDKTKSNVYILMQRDYNKIVKELQQQKRAEKKAIQIQEKKTPTMKIEKLKEFVSKWDAKKNKNNSFFEIILKSLSTNISHTFKFRGILHFENWFNKIVNQSEDSSGYVNENQNSNDIFKNVMVQDIKIITGGCNKDKNCCEKQIKTSFYNFNLYNPISKGNNCFLACIAYLFDIKETYHQLRKKFQLKGGEEISINKANEIIFKLNLEVEIIDYEINEELDDDKKYLLYNKNHYYVVKGFEENKLVNKKTKRGLLTFDFETRKTEEYHTIKASGQKMYVLKDVLCCVYYQSYKNTCENIKFITNDDKSSARRLIDWFNEESKNKRTYNVIAHNGGKFDYYFFISNLTSLELLECQLQFRGTTIIGINYRGHLFKDSCCFLTDSLKNLSKSFKITDGKITTFNIRGKEITSEQLCFYKNELTFNQFLDLQQSDKEFWELYEKYCLYDCIALFQIWKKFTECINNLIQKINPFLLRKCPLMSSNTIGSHSKKIIVELNNFKGEINYYKKNLELFTGITRETIDYKKYNFLCNFKRGGISHSHQVGKHLSGITGVDIASQYPASLIYSLIPTGKSDWIYEYNKDKKGFYLIKDLIFDSYLLKPVALSVKSLSLNWATNDMDELYVDSYMLKYIIENYGLKSFKVVEGLVSDKDVKGEKIFGKYINTFYDEKKQQDKYKSEKNELYNEALRTTIKLYLNSLTGKLVENPSIHFSMKFTENYNNSFLGKSLPVEELMKNPSQYDTSKVLNGQKIIKTTELGNVNDWLVAGIMVYSYSKRLLFEYIKCLPNNSNDVIHIETDGIYFSTRHLETFTKNLNKYEGDYPCKFGEDLGNLKIEKTTQEGQVAYFLGKKFYSITMSDEYNNKPRDKNDKNIYRVKGIPQTTINADGSSKYLVDVKLYDDIYNGKTVLKSFETLKKNLFCDNTSIMSYTMTRTIKGITGYKLYE